MTCLYYDISRSSLGMRCLGEHLSIETMFKKILLVPAEDG